MALSKKRNWVGRDRTEKRYRAQLRKQGTLSEYLEMCRAAKKVAQQVEAVPVAGDVVVGE